jgi:hypothetical protein
LSNYRAFVCAATAVLILAVDFKIFPRRLCKTETYGTGLMDVGVASFIFANAIVSPEARQHHMTVRLVCFMTELLIAIVVRYFLA